VEVLFWGVLAFVSVALISSIVVASFVVFMFSFLGGEDVEDIDWKN
jgi:hypothetical protein